jgi:hypothetical protein
MTAAKDIAAEIVAVAEDLGWRVAVRNNSILTITKDGIHSNDDFVRADMEYGMAEMGKFARELWLLK